MLPPLSVLARRWRSPFVTASVACASALLISACGGSSSPAPDPLAAYRNQSLAWQDCDPTILGAELEETLDALGERLRCAHMRAPLDWSKPERGDLYVAVMRLAAAQPQARQGALLFNPGGPGGDGLSLALMLWQVFRDGNPDTTLGAQQLRILDEFDMVGFSPRGVGASTALHCSTNELMRRVDRSSASAETLEDAAYNSRKMAQACLNNPLAPYINTDATARDLDLLRHLLDQDKLHYVGYSYGTWLGAWYASLFPERTGRMLLDSSVDFGSNFDDAFIGQAHARQHLHEQVLLPYAARHPHVFGMGSDAAHIHAQVLAMAPPVQDLLYAELEELYSSRHSAHPYLGMVRAALALDQALRQNPGPDKLQAVHQALNTYAYADDANQNQLARNMALGLFSDYQQRWLDYTAPSIYLDSEKSVYRIVVCNDVAGITDPQAWKQITRDLAPQAPIAFYEMHTNLCPYWGGPRVTHPGLAPLRALPLLTVQSQYDGATITENAERFYAQLQGAWHLSVPGEYTHGLFPYQDQCVDGTVLRYLLDGPDALSSAQRQLQCPMTPLPQDKATLEANAGSTPASMQKQASTGPATYRNPEKTQRLIDQFKDGIGPRSARQKSLF